jgi:phenylalanyl-tRNA synthetase alpha chain
MRLQNEKEVEKLRKMEEIVKKLRKKEIDMEEIEEEVKGLVREKIRKRGGKGVFKIKVEKELKYRITGLGEKLMKELKEEVEEISALTPEIIKEGSWRGKLFREYNIEMGAPRRLIGRFHPYKQFLHYVREKLVSLGFEEVSGEFVETEFWNMDALFMPQNHPARELHDVYFVKSPEYGKNLPSSLLSEVAKTHENGGKTGSCGWGYKFDKKKSRRLLLRSQGTAISVRLLALKPKPPKKYFSIARCFRKEAIDATHGDEFFQIEGIVVDKGVNFRTLLGLLEVFAVEIAGAKEVKFLPDYFPFTEPSVEVHGKHPEFGWLELGGAGIFREEVTLPLGVKVPVLAWGLGLDRMAMMGLNIKDIRELFSRDLGFLREVVYKL